MQWALFLSIFYCSCHQLGTLCFSFSFVCVGKEVRCRVCACTNIRPVLIASGRSRGENTFVTGLQEHNAVLYYNPSRIALRIVEFVGMLRARRFAFSSRVNTLA